nr:DUF262 domain-containing protein [Lachnospiraceae bacterium]
MNNNLILGIAKIGDLLINNKITDIGNNKSIEEINLNIPEYQRPYKWTVKNSNQLLDDIKDAMNSNKEVYRVGTLILHHDEVGNYNIVDGQQRTITFSLLLSSLKQGPVRFLNQNLSYNSYNIHNVMNNYRAFERQNAKLMDEKD